MILVSSCLAGLEVRYNGSHCLEQSLAQLVTDNKALPICPELLGGFVTPREPAEVIGGDGEDVLKGKARVVERTGKDVTDLYLKGAQLTLEKAQELQATFIVLKDYSPSCGSSMIYNGSFQQHKIDGVGVTAALLKKHGIRIVSEANIADVLNGK
ncbi:DUF523 domain-containing protein [Halalkalibacter urbisdiaboli]|uniref:DUF523 domain-containing protein n=1 Tax=Halalkalibacter urbisdiaboli TaxID=1960589 RepID=UPI000B440F13|nr:DUF523 domain-containing protein [Halalkalibacter urbisdiaboli]